MKKILSVLIAITFIFAGTFVNISAETPESTEVTVTISDKGNLVVTAQKITVCDTDNDNSVTVNDVLFTAHEKFFEGGAQSGYAFGETEYGVSIFKLWGDTSGNFGYYVNNAMAMGLNDTVKNGDSIYGYVFKNSDFSDVYSFFDKSSVTCDKNEEISLTLSYIGFDSNWNPVSLPVENAVISVNGNATEYKTDADGKVTFKLADSGAFVISAQSNDLTLVPPVCKVDIAEENPIINNNPPANNQPQTPENNESQIPKTGDSSLVFIFAALLVISVILISKKNIYEK